MKKVILISLACICTAPSIHGFARAPLKVWFHVVRMGFNELIASKTLNDWETLTLFASKLNIGNKTELDTLQNCSSKTHKEMVDVLLGNIARGYTFGPVHDAPLFDRYGENTCLTYSDIYESYISFFKKLLSPEEFEKTITPITKNRGLDIFEKIITFDAIVTTSQSVSESDQTGPDQSGKRADIARRTVEACLDAKIQSRLSPSDSTQHSTANYSDSSHSSSSYSDSSSNND